MIVHLQRAATTAALVPTFDRLGESGHAFRPRLIAAECRSDNARVAVPGDPGQVLGSGLLEVPVVRLGPLAPERPLWMCSVRSDPRRPDLSDAQWADVARRLVATAGLAPDGDPGGCRWAAIRNQDRTVHIIATTVREDGHLHRSYRDAFRLQSECHRIATELGHASQPLTPARPEVTMPRLITIAVEPSGAISVRGADDDLTAGLLRHAGFQQLEGWLGRRHRLPTSTPPEERAAIAAHAAQMLRAARYTVALDPKLGGGPVTTPTDPGGLKAAGHPVLQLTDRIRGATTAAQAAEALDQLLDPDDGVLPRLREALEAAAERVTDLDPDEYDLSERFSIAADWINNAEAELVDAIGDLRSLGAPPDLRELARQNQAAAHDATPFTRAALAASPAAVALGLRAGTAPVTRPPAPAAIGRPVGHSR
ncbi:hypothetical protein [Kitasatospora sp. LaBMicrA B282]|uniref:hypothetical protein n=1 Tax=Kitasatospora sp. LaBMicrA B282 TaxID=3420949 RepID=UPI003D0D10EF